MLFLRLVRFAAVIVLFSCLGGCAYYNTYYNVKRKFNEAEREFSQRETERSRPQSERGAGQRAQQGQRPAQNQSGVPAEKYRKVIETGSKLIEYYPKSRWIDDALLLMGISYFRMSDFTRAERKFSELISLYPNSEHMPQALLWKARSYIEQDRLDEAAEELQASVNNLKKSSEKAELRIQLGRIYVEKREWRRAAEEFETALSLEPSREQLSDATYQLAVCRFELQEFSAARDAYAKSAGSQRDVNRAFDCQLNVSRCHRQLGEFEQADRALRRLKDNGQFVQFQSDIDMEIAALAVSTGRVDDAKTILEQIITKLPNGEARGKAFLQLGKLHRDQLFDLKVAKSLFDSSVAIGSAREVVDSARAASTELGRGLTVFQAVSDLEDSVRVNTALLNSTDILIDSIAATDSVVTSPVLDDSAAVPAESRALRDSTQGVEVTSTRVTPAMLAADSIVRALEQADSLARAQAGDSVSTKSFDELENITTGDTLRSGEQGDTLVKSEAVSHQIPPAETNRQQMEGRLMSLRRQLQLAYLRAAEFYEFTLGLHDSAMTYYARAAAAPISPQVYWKSNLFLARTLSASEDSILQNQALDFYRAIVDADTVPVEAANEARVALSLEPIPLPDHAQRELFLRAEKGLLENCEPIDSVAKWYKQVAASDSESVYGKRSLFALFDIYDGQFQMPRTPDSARVYGEALLSLFAGSPEVVDISKILARDDNSSIFLLSDEDLMKQYQPRQVDIEEAVDEAGWPPAEESLRGRRYN